MKGFLNVSGDIAAGIIANTNKVGNLIGNGYYGLSITSLSKGDTIHTYAYPKTKHCGNKITFCGHYYQGKIEEYFPEGRDKVLLPNSYYQASMQILPGASEGPVFNSDGNLIGIKSTGFNDSESLHTSLISSIKDAFNIIIKGIKLPCGYKDICSIGELCNLGYVFSD